MSEQFDRLRQLLSVGATQDECLFYDCNDNVIIIGGTRQQTFKMPLTKKGIKKLSIVYTQDGNIILNKTLDQFTESDFDSSLLYFTLSEEETSRFNEGDVEAQLKLLLEDDTILVSSILYIKAIRTLDDMLFNTTKDYIAIQVTIKEQNVHVIQFKDIVANSKDVYKCKFIFDSSWDKFTKTINFKDENNNYITNINLDDDNCCVIPHQVISAPGNMYLGVVGKFEELVKPTDWSNSIRVSNSCNYTGKFIAGESNLNICQNFNGRNSCQER